MDGSPKPDTEKFTEAFSQLSAEDAAEHLLSLVSAHPESQKIGDGIAFRLINHMGMFGRILRDPFFPEGKKPDPDFDETRRDIYLGPYPRPLGASAIVPSYSDMRGNIFVLLVNNWVDRRNHDLGRQEQWQLAGGYLNAYIPGHPSDHDSDENMAAAAARELKEETSLNVRPEELLTLSVESDSRVKSESPMSFHPIFAVHLADLGHLNEQQEEEIRHQTIAQDDVHAVCWVNVNDIRIIPGSDADGKQPQYEVPIDGKYEPFFKGCGQGLKEVTKVMRKLRYYSHPLISDLDAFAPETQQQCKKIVESGFYLQEYDSDVTKKRKPDISWAQKLDWKKFDPAEETPAPPL